MGYTAPPTKNIGDIFTAAEFNTYIRDNAVAGVPAIFTTKGDLAVASGARAASRLAAGTDGDQLVANSAAGLGVEWKSRKWVTGQWSNTSWDGDSKSIGTTTITVNSFNAGVPNNAIAVLVWLAAKASSISGSGNLIRVATRGLGNTLVAARCVVANMIFDGCGVVPLTASGQFDVIVSEALAEVYLEIGGYLL